MAVDDAQWLDQPSAEALRFVARRLDAEGIVVVFSLRNGPAAPVTEAGLPEREIVGLDRDAVAAVLAAAGHQVAGNVVDRLCSQTDGNPLAILEVTSQLDDKQLLGHRSIDDPLPVGPSIELIFQRRLAAIPATTRTALVVAAADDTGRMDVLTAGLAYLGGEPSWLGMAARTGLVVIDNGRLQFCHPLARSATYHVASSDQRRTAHYALSTVDVPGIDDATRAWHRAAEPPLPMSRSRRSSSAPPKQQCGGERPVLRPVRFSAPQALLRLRPRRAARLLRAVEGWWLGNDRDAAATAAEEALAIADDPVVRADVVMFRGLAETWGGNAQGAVRMMTAEAEAVVNVDAARATDLLTKAVAACLAGGEMGEARRLGERAMELGARVGGASMVEGQTALASACAFTGDGDLARELAEPLIVLAQGMADVPATGDLLQVAALLALSTEQLDRAEDLLNQVMQIGRTKDRLGLVTYALFLLSEIESRDGRWADAYAHQPAVASSALTPATSSRSWQQR